jgi:hypothetical protein
MQPRPARGGSRGTAGAGAGAGAVNGNGPTTAAARARVNIAAQAAVSLRDAWRRRIGSLASRNYRLSEPLLALHGVILRELGDDEGLAAHLAETAALARKAGCTAEGLRSVHQLRVLAAGAAPFVPGNPAGDADNDGNGGGGGDGAGAGEKDDPDGWGLHPMSSPLARWRLEETKLLWASDRSQMAMGLGKHLMESIAPGIAEAIVVTDGNQAELDNASGLAAFVSQGGGSQGGRRGSYKGSKSGAGRNAAPTIPLQDPRFFETMSLVNKWQAATRRESAKTILAQCIGAVYYVGHAYQSSRKGELVSSLPPSSRGRVPSTANLLRLVSRLNFRLAHYADSLYSQSEERLSSPEWAQSEKLRARNEEELATLKEERAAAKAKVQRAGANLTRDESFALEEEHRMLHRRIYPLEKQVLLDREETQLHLQERGKWLMLALQGYRRCLENAGNSGSSSGSDQRVIFRIVAIWFSICGGIDGSSVKGNAADDAALVRQVNEEVSKIVKRASVPSSKFLVLSYQICGRLGTAPQEGNTFPAVIRQLVDRMVGLVAPFTFLLSFCSQNTVQLMTASISM